ncbi:uncharacterized protein LOC111406707 [Olea europaea var. sylvestris]|uniref:uncharacterized protein LOC111406707 n=1 Tax=Olea europaea var. sylvestris TaxID=158386 RepID=UPI000C1CF9AD|nr:uncharacterized protein LOC111406707 [Olea europaea var. sylvestris]
MKLSLSFYAIQNMFEYVVVRSDKKDYLVKCSRDECNWTCRASKLARTDMFKIRHIVEGHICASNIVLSTHRQVTKTVVSTCIKYKYTSSRTIYTPNDIRNNMLHTYEVSLNYVKAWQSREETLKMLRGDPTYSFNKIPTFFFVLQQTNPGSVTSLEIDAHNRFKYCFVALSASIRGWKHCRLVGVVDGTYLNRHYCGTLFTACTQDANNSIYVLAFGIGDNENDSSWTWFFRQLRKEYGDRDGLCLCRIVTTASKKRFKTCIREHVRGYDEVGPERWSHFHMPSNRYSTMTSNIVESVNAVTKSAKNYPILALLESLRQILQSWFCRHKEDAQGTFTTLSSKYEKKMREMSTNMRNLRVFPINQAMFSVRGERSPFIVDIENRTCTCRMFQVDQLPCPHALAVFASMKMDPYEYCYYYYTSEAFRNTYQETIFPVGNPAEWIVPNDVHDIVVIAPNQKRSCRRPTEKIFRPEYEENITVKCGRCGESDHNRRTCSSLVPLSQSNKNKERKRTKTGNTH